ncbi:hypothetical protein ACQY0O_003761 [Thecaphora frezii]
MPVICNKCTPSPPPAHGKPSSGREVKQGAVDGGPPARCLGGHDTVSSSPVEAFPSPPHRSAPPPPPPSARKVSYKPKPLDVVSNNRLGGQDTAQPNPLGTRRGSQEKPIGDMRDVRHGVGNSGGRDDDDDDDDDYGPELDDEALLTLAEIEARGLLAQPTRAKCSLPAVKFSDNVCTAQDDQRWHSGCIAATSTVNERPPSEVDELDERSDLSQQEMLDYVTRGGSDPGSSALTASAPSPLASRIKRYDHEAAAGDISDTLLCSVAYRPMSNSQGHRSKVSTLTQPTLTPVKKRKVITAGTSAVIKDEAASPVSARKRKKAVPTTQIETATSTSSTLPVAPSTSVPMPQHPPTSSSVVPAPPDAYPSSDPLPSREDPVEPVYRELRSKIDEMYRLHCLSLRSIRGQLAQRDIENSKLRDEKSTFGEENTRLKDENTRLRDEISMLRYG